MCNLYIKTLLISGGSGGDGGAKATYRLLLFRLWGFLQGGAGGETGCSTSSAQIVEHHLQSALSHLVTHLLLLLLFTKIWEMCVDLALRHE